MALPASSQTWTLKVSLDGEVRRLKSWPSGGEEPSMRSLLKAVCDLFEVEEGSLRLHYTDDEGDLCTLTQTTLPDAVQLSAHLLVWRLTASRVGQGIPTNQFEGHAFEETSGIDSWTHVSDVDDAAQQVSEEPFQSPRSTQHEEARTQPPSNPSPSMAAILQRFQDKVAEDFRATRQDMQVAAAAQQRGEATGPIAQNFGEAAGTLVALVAATRLVPLRATRLAADSVAVLCGNPVADDTAVAPDGSSPASRDEPDGNSIEHFKKQVASDFELARCEVRGAFASIMGRGAASAATPETTLTNQQPDEHPEQQQQQQQQQHERGRVIQTVTHAVASNIAGVTVASTMLPLRAIRLAVAASAKALSGREPVVTSAPSGALDAEPDAAEALHT